MDSSNQSTAPPVHDEMGIVVQSIEALSIALACTLLILNSLRFLRSATFDWGTLVAVVLAFPAADFVSGLVHWTADTWGSEQWPLIGRRFLRPFRVHHINPHDFLRRNFVDTNGDVAMVSVPLLAALFFVPLENAGGRFVVALAVSFFLFSLPTNQIHQWSHMPSPPSIVTLLQRCGLILPVRQHQAHHDAPYTTNYCIVNGSCNPTLAHIDFFPRVERLISRVTGLQPRAEEQNSQKEA